MKKVIKKNWGFFLGIIIFIILNYLPLPYIVRGPGGLASLKDHYKISNQTTNNYYLAYVSEYSGTPMTLLYGLLHKDCEIEKVSYEDQDAEDIIGSAYLKDSQNNAVSYAYKKRGYEVLESEKKLLVSYVYKEAKKTFKINDEIIKVNGKEVFSIEDIKNNFNGEKEIFEIKRDGEIKEIPATYTMIDGKEYLGIAAIESVTIKTNPEIIFNFSKKESGSSGGLILSLSIYDLLTEEDIAKNRKIAGTGTIDKDGNVGKIGSIKYKILGAIHDKADIFFVPEENYEDAKSICDVKKCKFDLVKVTTFDEALAYLKKA